MYIFTHFPSARSRALVRAMISAFCVKLPGGRAFASTILSRGTTAYPVHHLPWSTKLLPWMSSSISGLARAWSVKSSLLEGAGSMACRRSRSGDCAASIGSNVAGLRAEVTWSLTLGLSRRMAWYFLVLPEVSQ